MITRTPLADDQDAIPTTPALRCHWEGDEAVEEARPHLENLARIVARIVDRQDRSAEDQDADAA
jgi:hypothetical protein